MTDSNLHSALCNPDTYHSQDAAADNLVEVRSQWNMCLRSPKGFLTYKSKQGMSLGTTIDIFWLNQPADNLLVACLVDSEDTLNHHLDYKAIITFINKKRDDGCDTEMDNSSYCAWHKANQASFL